MSGKLGCQQSTVVETKSWTRATYRIITHIYNNATQVR